jgi:glutathione S-transferase
VELIQVPWSHNCVKVRVALEHKGLEYQTRDLTFNRLPAKRASGQLLVPVLLDRGRTITDSTAILLYLEEQYPRPTLLPDEPAARAECLVLEDWADAAFMAVSRRLVYWSPPPALVGATFFPAAPALLRRPVGFAVRWFLRARFGMSRRRNARDESAAREAAELAVRRLAGRSHLVGERLSVADIALAAMSGPLALAPPSVRDDANVAALVRWGRGVLGRNAFSPERVREWAGAGSAG